MKMKAIGRWRLDKSENRSSLGALPVVAFGSCVEKDRNAPMQRSEFRCTYLSGSTRHTHHRGLADTTDTIFGELQQIGETIETAA
jgi:hypothetical protein